MRILLTAYGPFKKVPENITEKIADAITVRWNHTDDELIILKIPVEWRKTDHCLKQALEQLNPDVVISMGHAEKYSAITVETRYFNIAEGEDNQGITCKQGMIDFSAPAHYDTNINALQLASRLVEKNIPAVLHADKNGMTYLCNFAGYTVMHHIRSKKLQKPLFVFLHLPPTLPFLTLVQGVEEIIDFLAHST